MTAPVVGGLTSRDVAGFLKAQGFPAEAFDGHIPSQPDRLVIVALTGGPGLAVEAAFDNISFQIRVRGLQREKIDGPTAEDDAWAIDRMLLEHAVPGQIGAQWVNAISRVGGPPGFLLRDSAQRIHLTCNYIFAVARY